MKMCYVIYNFIRILKKAFGKDIAKGRQHWFHREKEQEGKLNLMNPKNEITE